MSLASALRSRLAPRLGLRPRAPAPLAARSGARPYSTPPPRPIAQQCPQCATPNPLPTTPCQSCSTLLPLPAGLSHHSLLDLSQPVPAGPAFSSAFDLPAEFAQLPAHGYVVDVKDARQRMLRKQQALHPDRYASQGDRVVGLARELSGRVNEAYAVLADPLKRAEYILSAHALATEETDSIADPLLLAEILEAREELESATTEEQVTAVREANHRKVEATIQAITEAFSTDPPNFTEAKHLATQLRYWQGLEKVAREWSPSS